MGHLTCPRAPGLPIQLTDEVTWLQGILVTNPGCPRSQYNLSISATK